MAKAPADKTASLGFEDKLWLAADVLRNNLDPAEYKHVVLGLIFLKYISDAFEEVNPVLKGALPKAFGLPALDKQKLGELINLISGIGLGTKEHRNKDTLGRVYEYFLSRLPRPKGAAAASSTRPRAWCAYSSRCWSPTRGASTTSAAARAACSCSR